MQELINENKVSTNLIKHNQRWNNEEKNQMLNYIIEYGLKYDIIGKLIQRSSNSIKIQFSKYINENYNIINELSNKFKLSVEILTQISNDYDIIINQTKEKNICVKEQKKNKKIEQLNIIPQTIKQKQLNYINKVNILKEYYYLTDELQKLIILKKLTSKELINLNKQTKEDFIILANNIISFINAQDYLEQLKNNKKITKNEYDELNNLL